MSRPRRHGAATLLVAGLTVGLHAACADVAPAPAPVPVAAQRSHVQCPVGGTEARTIWLRQAQQWPAAIGLDEVAALGRRVDWSREQVLVHALARQTTLGHAVEPAAAAASVVAGELRLPVSVRRPAPDAMVGMAFSRPCTIVIVPGGGWREVVVLDAADGRELGRAH